MLLNTLLDDSIHLQYPISYDPWKAPECEGKILFVGGIPLDCTSKELHTYLSKFDEVLWQRIELDSNTGLPRGFAYAVLASTDGYTRILKHYGHRMRNLKIGVSLWKNPKDYLNEKDKVLRRKVFIKRLNPVCSDADLYDHFSVYGKIEKAEVRRNHGDNTSRRIGFVSFEREEDANKCLEAKCHIMNGREIIVKKCRNLTDVKKERSLINDTFDSNRHHSYTLSEDSMQSHKDWSFFSQSAAPYGGNVLNSSLSLKELDELPSFNVSGSFLLNTSTKIAATNSTSDIWKRGVVPIKEEDETAETNFSPPFGLHRTIPRCSELAVFEESEEPAIDFFCEPKFKIEARVAYYTFPGYS